MPRERVAFNAFRQRAAPIGGDLWAACDDCMAGDESGPGVLFDLYIIFTIVLYIYIYMYIHIYIYIYILLHNHGLLQVIQ